MQECKIKPTTTHMDVRKHPLSNKLVSLYRFPRLQSVIIKAIKKLEGGEFYSETLRRIYKDIYGISIGRYSYGCFSPDAFPEGTNIGNYVSIAENVHCLRRNHPYDRITQHPFFYNRHLNIVSTDTISQNKDNPLTIGHDVWIGRQTTILPGCKRIGNGAIIGAGSIVTKDVPDFCIFAGNPAKVIKMRFSPDVISVLNQTEWWNLSLSQLLTSNIPFDERADIEVISSWKQKIDLLTSSNTPVMST